MPFRNGSDRPLIAIPARFSETASVLRFRGEVVPRLLVEAVFAAGGEPIVVHPHAPRDLSFDEVDRRLSFADGVLLPGGGDVSRSWTHAELDDPDPDCGVDLEQDRFDLAVARWAVKQGVPLLAICRGMQVLNVALGGRIVRDMSDLPGSPEPHLTRIHEVTLASNSTLGRLLGDQVDVSCFHHQCVEELAPTLRAVGYSREGIIEAVEVIDPDDHPWVLGLQWHPEDTAMEDPKQMLLFQDLVRAASAARSMKGNVTCV